MRLLWSYSPLRYRLFGSLTGPSNCPNDLQTGQAEGRLRIGPVLGTPGDQRPALSLGPRVTLTTEMVSFSRLITGQAGGPALFTTDELRVSGDPLFVQQILRFFDQPEA